MLRVWLRERPLALAVAIGFALYILLRLATISLWVLVLILVAVILAAALMPIVRIVDRVALPPYGWHIPRAVTVVVVYLIVIVLVGTMIYIVGALLVREFILLLHSLPDIAGAIATRLQELSDSLGVPSLVPSPADVSAYVRSLLSNLTYLVGLVEAAIGAVVFFLIGLFFVLFLALFLVIDAEDILGFWVSLFPPDQRDHVRGLSSRIGYRIGRWVIGQFTVAVLSGILAGIAAFILGLPYPLVIGAATSLLDLAPFLGPSVMVYPVFFLGLSRSIYLAVASALVFYGLAHVDGNVLSPLITGRAVRISPSLVIIALPIGLALYGAIGTLIAVPVAAALKIITTDVLIPWLRRLQGVPEEPGQ